LIFLLVKAKLQTDVIPSRDDIRNIRRDIPNLFPLNQLFDFLDAGFEFLVGFYPVPNSFAGM